MHYPPGTTIQVHSINANGESIDWLAPFDGRLGIVTHADTVAYTVALADDGERTRLVPRSQVSVPTLTVLLLVDGFARIGLETLKHAVFDTFGDPTEWTHGTSMVETPHVMFEAHYDLDVYPGESLESIVWRMAVQAWRGSRIRPNHPIPKVQVRVFTDYGAENEQQHGEWAFGADDHAALLAAFPKLMNY